MLIDYIDDTKNVIFQVQFRNGIRIVGRGRGCQRLYGNGVGSRNDKSHFADSIDTGDLRVIQFLRGNGSTKSRFTCSPYVRNFRGHSFAFPSIVPGHVVLLYKLIVKKKKRYFNCTK